MGPSCRIYQADSQSII